MMFAKVDIEYDLSYMKRVANEGTPLMLFQEIYARVWLIALMVIFTAYFGALTILHAEGIGLTFLDRIILLAIALGSLGVIALATYGWHWARRNPDEATDERDLQIDRRATQIAYYVLMAGIIYAGAYLPFLAKDPWEVVHAALFFIAIAEIVHSALVIRFYRRGLRA